MEPPLNSPPIYGVVVGIDTGLKYELKIKESLHSILKKTSSLKIEIDTTTTTIDKCEKEIEKGWRKYSGLALAVLSSFIISLTALLVKQFDGHSPISISLWRFQGALWPIVPLFIQHKLKGCVNKVKKTNSEKLEKGLCTRKKLKIFALLMTRTFLSTNAFLLNFFSLKYLEMGDALAVAASTPVFVTLFAHYFLGEECGLVPILTALITLFGVIVIARPPHLTGEETFDFDTLIGTSLALGCMLLGCISFVVLRSLRKVHYTSIILAFGIWGTLENLFLGILFGVLSFPEGKEEWVPATLLFSLTLVGQLSIVFALKKEQASPVAILRTCDVLFAFGLQVVFLGRLPDVYSLIGSTIIIFGIILTTLRKWVASLPANNSWRKRFQVLLI